MTYFPPRDTSSPKPSKCPGCSKWHIPTPGMEMTSCCVNHAPGSCCHYSETEVPEDYEDFLAFQSLSIKGMARNAAKRRKR